MNTGLGLSLIGYAVFERCRTKSENGKETSKSLHLRPTWCSLRKWVVRLCTRSAGKVRRQRLKHMSGLTVPVIWRRNFIAQTKWCWIWQTKDFTYHQGKLSPSFRNRILRSALIRLKQPHRANSPRVFRKPCKSAQPPMLKSNC